MILSCPVCDKEFYIKPSHYDKLVHKSPTCSRECSNTLRADWMRGSGNHQYGLTGELNASFKGQIKIWKRGTNKYLMVFSPDHPYRESNNHIRAHRLIVEQNKDKFDSKYFIQLGDHFYLNPQYDVHHKDRNSLNNALDNLEIVSRGEHTKIHNKDKIIVRARDGRIIGIIKLGELLENLEAGNQQPSIGTDDVVPMKVQRLGGEESDQ